MEGVQSVTEESEEEDSDVDKDVDSGDYYKEIILMMIYQHFYHKNTMLQSNYT